MQALPKYYDHLMNNDNSLIARIYGIFQVNIENTVQVSLLIMANTIRCDDSHYIKNVFDLKGSVINRHVKITKNTKNTSTLKDQNFQ